MAYKLYINNKLFNGIGNNNYNKGVITINGVDYQYDNSSGSSLPTYNFYWKKTTNGTSLDYQSPNYFSFGGTVFGGTATTVNEIVDDITFEYAGNTNGSTRMCQILLSDFINDNNINISNYNINVNVYLYASSAKTNRNVEIGGTAVSTLLKGLNKYSGTIDINNNSIYVGADNTGKWCGIYVTLTPKS